MDWPRTHFSSDAMHWWRANWQALPAQGAVREISAEIETTPVTKRAISPGDFAWVMTETDEWAPCVAIESDSTEDFYDIDAAYEEARISLDPSLSPHGAFRALEHGNHAAAVEFTNRFGLLSLPVPGPSLHGGACAPFFRVRDRRWMNLDHFWSRHARYVAISALWEPYSGSGPGTLPQAWAQLIARLDEINKLGPSLLDSTEQRQGADLERLPHLCGQERPERVATPSGPAGINAKHDPRHRRARNQFARERLSTLVASDREERKDRLCAGP